MITDIVGEKKIDLAYLIWDKKVTVVSMFSDNIQYEFMKPWMIELESRNKQVTGGTYMRRQLINLMERKIELTQFDKDPQIKRMNKLAGIMEIVLNLDKLDNTDNLENGKPSDTLFMYHLAAYDNFEPYTYTTQYKKLKNGELISLALRITHMKNKVMTDGLATTVMLQIQ